MAKQFDPTKTDDIQYNVHIPGYHTNKKADDDIMSREVWLEGVETSFFIDYDGYGDGLTENMEYVQRLRPSIAEYIRDDVKWIVWFNK